MSQECPLSAGPISGQVSEERFDVRRKQLARVAPLCVAFGELQEFADPGLVAGDGKLGQMPPEGDVADSFEQLHNFPNIARESVESI